MLKSAAKPDAHVSLDLDGGVSLPTREKLLPVIVKKIANYAAIASLGLGVAAPREAEGALYANGTPSSQPIALGLQFAGEALSLRIFSPLYAGGQKDTSATFLNSGYALTSYHNFSDVLSNLTNLEVADGPNYLSNRGSVMPISGYIVNPTLDLAILKFAQPYYASADKQIGIAGVGDITYSAGFGSWGMPSTGTSRDGNLRAWDARVIDTVLGGGPPLIIKLPTSALGI